MKIFIIIATLLLSHAVFADVFVNFNCDITNSQTKLLYSQSTYEVRLNYSFSPIGMKSQAVVYSGEEFVTNLNSLKTDTEITEVFVKKEAERPMEFIKIGRVGTLVMVVDGEVVSFNCKLIER